MNVKLIKVHYLQCTGTLLELHYFLVTKWIYENEPQGETVVDMYRIKIFLLDM